MSFLERDSTDDAARAEDIVTLDREIHRRSVLRIIAAFDVHLRANDSDKLGRGRLIENGHVVHTFQRGHDFRSLVLWIDWPVRPLQPAH